MLIKQQMTGETWAIGGNPTEIFPLHTSLYNWQGIHPFGKCEPPMDLGAPESFVYFLIKKERYIKARMKAFLNQIGGGSLELERRATAEFNKIETENFLVYGDMGMVEEIFEMEGNKD